MDWARRIELVTVVVAAAVAVVGLWYSNVQTRQANEQARNANTQARDDRELAKEGQITDRYTAAVGNLGEDKMDVRLGGIYALQRIMQDSPRDQPTISNVLAAYIRTHAAKPPAGGQGVPADVHAAFTVLTSRDIAQDGAFHLDLHGAQLPNITPLAEAGSPAALHNADLSNTDLTGVDLRDADLTSANLAGADLTDTDLREMDLHEVDLGGADLTDANLTGANLGYTNLSGADLGGADLTDANLTDANLAGTDLRDTNLTEQQLRSALISTSTRIR